MDIALGKGFLEVFGTFEKECDAYITVLEEKGAETTEYFINGSMDKPTPKLPKNQSNADSTATGEGGPIGQPSTSQRLPNDLGAITHSGLGPTEELGTPGGTEGQSKDPGSTEGDGLLDNAGVKMAVAPTFGGAEESEATGAGVPGNASGLDTGSMGKQSEIATGAGAPGDASSLDTGGMAEQSEIATGGGAPSNASGLDTGGMAKRSEIATGAGAPGDASGVDTGGMAKQSEIATGAGAPGDASGSTTGGVGALPTGKQMVVDTSAASAVVKTAASLSPLSSLESEEDSGTDDSSEPEVILRLSGRIKKEPIYYSAPPLPATRRSKKRKRETGPDESTDDDQPPRNLKQEIFWENRHSLVQNSVSDLSLRD